MDQFYVTLISNGSRQTFPDNNPGNFTIELNHAIHLTHDWKVGLAAVQFGEFKKVLFKQTLEMKHEIENICFQETFTINNEQTKSISNMVEMSRSFSELNLKLHKGYVLHLSNTNFKKIFVNNHESISSFRIVLSQDENQFDITIGKLQKSASKILDLENYLQDFTAHLPNGCSLINNQLTITKGVILELSPPLTDLLGLKNDILTEGKFHLFPFDYKDLIKVHSYHIYSDCIQSQLVSHSYAPLLRAVPTTERYQNFSPIFYLPLKKTTLTSIEVQICSNQGLDLQFDGVCHITLHFKK